MKTKKPMQNVDEAPAVKKAKFSKETKGKPPQNTIKNEKPEHRKFAKPNGNASTNKFSKGAKPPYNKVKNGKDSKLEGQSKSQEKPTDWNQYKKEKKELREKRRSSRSLIDVIVKAKAIGEKIRVKKIPAAERTKLINELHELMGNQGSYVKFVLTHDMARIVQYMLKHGSADVRQSISTEIIPSTVLMLQSKYGKFVVKWMLKYGSQDVRSKCIQMCYGNAVKLASHAVSAPIFEYAYSEFATQAEKLSLIQEFFGDMYKQTKDANVKHLRDVYMHTKDMKAAALSATKANLARIMNKNLLDSGLVQSVVAQFLRECSADDRAELISQLAPHIVVLSNSKDGANAAMNCFWHGTNKDRKTAMKAIKEHIIDMCKHEHAHTAIICLLDSADDTVLLNKAILGEIIKRAEELIADDWGRRVLAWIVAPADRKQFHPMFIRELEEGRAASTCKKDAIVRRREIVEHCIRPLLEKIVELPRVWYMDPKSLLVTAQILLNENVREIAGPAFSELAKLATDLAVLVDEYLYIENSGISMSLKRLLQNDRNIQGDDTFGNAIVEGLDDNVIAIYVILNRGCFFLADIYSNNKASTQKKLKELLQPHLDLIKEQHTKGAEILLQKLA